MNAAGCGFRIVQKLCEAEVQHLHLARRRYHHVSRLDVAMNDAPTVRCRECVGDLQTDQQRRFQFEWTACDELPHILAFNELHRDEMEPVNFVQIVDSADVWMVQRRCEARFAFESFQVCFLRAQFRWNDLDHNRASEFEVGRFVHFALPAHTELVSDAIVAKSLTYHFVY